MVTRSRFLGLVFWLVIASAVGGIGRIFFSANFWVVAGLTIFSLAVNGLIIEWEDRQRGGWSE